MKTFRGIAREYRWLGLALLLAAATSAAITSCGGSGGSSDGALCQQCGDTDGPCQAKTSTETGVPGVIPGINNPEPCPTPPATLCVQRTLICRRKIDSAQQRCYPGNDATTQINVDTNFKCDGSRPGGTPGPVSTAATPTPTPNALCGNGVLDNLEDCDDTNLDGKRCGNFCASDDGILLCRNCRFDFSRCTGLGCPF